LSSSPLGQVKFKKPKKRRKIKKRETLKVNVSELLYVLMFSFYTGGADWSIMEK